MVCDMLTAFHDEKPKSLDDFFSGNETSTQLFCSWNCMLSGIHTNAPLPVLSHYKSLLCQLKCAYSCTLCCTTFLLFRLHNKLFHISFVTRKADQRTLTQHSPPWFFNSLEEVMLASHSSFHYCYSCTSRILLHKSYCAFFL